MGPGLQPVSVMHVPGSKAQPGPDKGEGCAALSHVLKARFKHDTMDFYSGRAGPFGLSCYVPGLARCAMNSLMT
jgi:hypothetical protein